MPVKVTANRDTWLKKLSTQAALLNDSDKRYCAEGSSLILSAYNKIEPETPQERKITCANGLGTWWIHSSHWDGFPQAPSSSLVVPPSEKRNPFGLWIPDAGEADYKLPVAYFSQLDNTSKYQGSGSRQCRTSATAMQIDYVTKNAVGREALKHSEKAADDYWGRLILPYDSTEPAGHIIAAKQFNVTLENTTMATVGRVSKSLEKGFPVAMGVRYKYSGHWICAVGEKGLGFYIHDPYGVRNGASNSYSPDLDGAYDVYTLATLRALFLDYGDETSGYAQFVTKIDGIPTGV